MEDKFKIYNDLLNGKTTIDKLNANILTHKQAVYDFIKDRPNYIDKFEKDSEIAFLNYLIETDYKLFIYVKPEHYTEKLAKIYLFNKIKSATDYKDGFISKSFENLTCVNLNYQTCDGEEIIYYDTDVEAVTFLIAKIFAKLKIFDTVKLLKKLDLVITDVGYNTVSEFFINAFNRCYRKVITKTVVEDKIGVYKINLMRDDLEVRIAKEFNEEFEKFGVTAEEVSINKLSISDAAGKILEEQSLLLLREKKENQIRAEYEKSSLENYAKKAQIHTDNPNFAVGLTEAEKDLALNRYFKKVNFERGITDALPKSTELEGRSSKIDDTLSKKLDKELAKLTQSKLGAASLLYLAGAIALIVAFTAFVNVFEILICLGIAVFFIGTGIACSISKKSAAANQNKVETKTFTNEFVNVTDEKTDVSDVNVNDAQ